MNKTTLKVLCWIGIVVLAYLVVIVGIQIIIAVIGLISGGGFEAIGYFAGTIILLLLCVWGIKKLYNKQKGNKKK